MFYNHLVTTFAEWLLFRFEQWSNETGGDKGAFARWLGVPPTSLSNWLNGGFKPRGDNLGVLAEKLGNEVYSVLGLPSRETPIPIDVLPPAMRLALVAATRELADTLAENKIDPDSPEAEALTISVMARHGFNWTQTVKGSSRNVK